MKQNNKSTRGSKDLIFCVVFCVLVPGGILLHSSLVLIPYFGAFLPICVGIYNMSHVEENIDYDEVKKVREELARVWATSQEKH